MILIAGILVGTLAIFAIMFGAWRLFRCIHAWELVDKTEMDSGFENMAKAGFREGACWPGDYARLASRTVIIAMRCPKCGAARIFKEKSAL